MSADIDKLNFHLLTVLGLSRASAEIVMDRITDLETEVVRVKSARHEVETKLNDALVEIERLRKAVP